MWSVTVEVISKFDVASFLVDSVTNVVMNWLFVDNFIDDDKYVDVSIVVFVISVVSVEVKSTVVWIFIDVVEEVDRLWLFRWGMKMNSLDVVVDIDVNSAKKKDRKTKIRQPKNEMKINEHGWRMDVIKMGTKIVDAKRIPAIIQLKTIQIFFATESFGVDEITFKSLISMSSLERIDFISVFVVVVVVGSIGSIWIIVDWFCSW